MARRGIAMSFVSTVAMSTCKTVQSHDRKLNSCSLFLCNTVQKFWKFNFRGIGERKSVFLSLRVWVTPFYLDIWKSRNISICLPNRTASHRERPWCT
jgi:hypothetical protein